MSGRFIVLEGMEGAGKTTQVELLVRWLAARQVPYLATREPGGTEMGEAIRRILLESGPVSEAAELMLFLAARAALLADLVRPALAEGRVVLADRFEMSTLAYQGYGRGLALADIRVANRLATGGLRPDLTIVLDLPAPTGLARVAGRAGAADRIEGEGEAFLSRVGEAYRLLASTEPDVVRVDATPPPDVVHEEIVRLLSARFPETFAETAG
jgi:dTMP kinase